MVYIYTVCICLYILAWLAWLCRWKHNSATFWSRCAKCFTRSGQIRDGFFKPVDIPGLFSLVSRASLPNHNTSGALKNPMILELRIVGGLKTCVIFPCFFLRCLKQSDVARRTDTCLRAITDSVGIWKVSVVLGRFHDEQNSHGFPHELKRSLLWKTRGIFVKKNRWPTRFGDGKHRTHLCWLVVTGTWLLWLSVYWECHHPNQRTHIFWRGWNPNQYDILMWWLRDGAHGAVNHMAFRSKNHFRKRITRSEETPDDSPVRGARFPWGPFGKHTIENGHRNSWISH